MWNIYGNFLHYNFGRFIKITLANKVHKSCYGRRPCTSHALNVSSKLEHNTMNKEEIKELIKKSIEKLVDKDEGR